MLQDKFSFTSPGTTLKEKRALPNHYCGAASAFWKFKGSRIILLFGGEEREGSIDSASTRLTAFDIDNYLWWYVGAAEQERIPPRVDACATIINNCLFLFGGDVCLEEGQEFLPARSFSIAEFDSTMDRWRWVVYNQKYPDEVPNFGSLGGCMPIQDGKKILLTPGITDDGSEKVRIYIPSFDIKMADSFVVSF